MENDNPLSQLSEATRARIWAAFRALNHQLRSKEIELVECVRTAYATARRELCHEEAVALVVHFGRQLRWLASYEQISRQVRAHNPVYREIPEAEQYSAVNKLVADLIVTAPPTTEGGIEKTPAASDSGTVVGTARTRDAKRAGNPTKEQIAKMNTVQTLVGRIKARHRNWTMAVIVSKIRIHGDLKIEDSTFYRCRHEPHRVSPEMMNEIIAALKTLASE
jgi:hypothetical protein